MDRGRLRRKGEGGQVEVSEATAHGPEAVGGGEGGLWKKVVDLLVRLVH